MNKQPRAQGERNDIALSLRRIRKIAREQGSPLLKDDAETVISDLLADIRHYCHTADIDYYEASDRAYGYYRDERNIQTQPLDLEEAA